MLFVYFSVCVLCLVHSGVANYVEEKAKPKCGYNEVEVPCRQICPPQNCDIAYTDYACTEESKICEPGCNCLPDHLRNGSGICIPNEECHYPSTPVCGLNEIARDCKQICPPQTCLSKYALFDCIADIPCEPGCDCVPNYLRDDKGKCIPSEKCPPPKPICGYNEVAVPCRQKCPPQNCEIAYTEYACTNESKICEPGCDCLPDHLRNGSGICVPNEECTYPSTPVCGLNEIARDCKRICPPQTCLSKYALFKCVADLPCEPGCDCVPNYLRDDKGICIPSEKCPLPKPICGYNEVAVPCRQKCPPQNCEIAYTEYACTNESKICEPGCDCLPDHLRNGSGICVPNEECTYPSTPVCGLNEIARHCKRICPPQTCLSKYALFKCSGDLPCEPGCDCVPNYLRDDKGKCIPSEKCPPPKPICGYNEVAVPCRQKCPPQNCEIAYTEYACTNESKICEPGCDCLPDHLRNGSGICVPNEECTYPLTPVCGLNEIARDCKRICPPQTCLSKYALFRCVEDLPCEPGCDCVPNYLRDDRGMCIPSEQCPTPCQIPDECKRTCAKPNPPNCEYNPPKMNMNGCACKDGYILSDIGGDCIPIDECPPEIACHGDPNARPKRCPKPCPSTCKSPNQLPCKRMCDPIGCQCKSGHILSNDTGLCILPDKCPGGDPCGKKARFVDCKTDCPGDYCPVDDNRDLVFCDPPAEKCLSGCICTFNHRRKSHAEPRCIVSSDCPRINCTRPNEKWSSCPSACLAEDCEDITNQPTVCNTLILNCNPKCICRKNHFRNSSGICIPAKDCRCNGDPNAVHSDCPSACEPTCNRPNPEACSADCKPAGCVCKPGYVLNEDDGKCIELEDCPVCQIPDECKRTCAEPNPPNCEYNPPKMNMNGCACKDGYILSDIGGDCIHIDECPPEIACHGDPNARPKRCPKPCPSTCKSPNQLPCKRMCDPIGCQCKSGHILSNDTGLCILPDKCPGGDPCGKKARFVDCKTDCPGDYCPVDDNRDFVFCDPPAEKCLSGCICTFNHRRKCRADPRCIVSSDCPRINCTRPNEKWSSCPSACLAEDCEDVTNQPTVCNTLILNCNPKCICKKNHFRNSSGICIPAKDCPTGCNGDPNAVHSDCPSACEPTCNRPNPEACSADCKPAGCVCKPGYVLNEDDGKCIELEDCPGCGGDPNAVYKDSPSACEPTCSNPNPQNCTDECKPSGCVCKRGFVLNEEDGQCIHPESCPDC